MTKDVISVLSAGILLVGCVASTPPFEVTVEPTVEPTVVVTVDPTPTQEVLINPHGFCVANNPVLWETLCVVNTNPDLVGVPVGVTRGESVYDVPPNYVIASGGQLGKPPNMRCLGGDCTLSIEWLNGKHGYSFDNTQLYPNQRYLIKVVARLNVTYLSTYESNLREGEIGIGASVTKRGVTRDLPTQWIMGDYIPLRGNAVNMVWLVEPTERWQPRFTIYVDIPFGIAWQFSTLTIYSIQVIPVPSDYRGVSFKF